MDLLHLILRSAARATWQLAPYVVFGVLLGEALRHTPAVKVLVRACRKRPSVAVFLAAALGASSPLCTYGTVPVVLELLRGGLPIAPLATFLATSSLMNPQLFLLTWGGLGSKMATARLLSVLGFGLLLGLVLLALPRRWSVQPAVIREQAPARPRHAPFHAKDFAKNSWRTLEFVGFYVLLGTLLGAAIEVLVPGRWIMAAFGNGGWVDVLLAALLGVPLYACGGGTIPLVSSLMGQGMAGGAALAFLVAGPATRVPPLLALATILRPAFILTYVIALLLYSMLVGLAYGVF